MRIRKDAVRSAAILGLAVGLLGGAEVVSAQIPCGGYEVTAIVSMDECPPFGNPPVIPTGINEQGWMVGYFNACVIGPNTAFLWTPDDGLVVIPMPAGTIRSWALAISGSKVVGYHDISGDELGNLGFLYDYETDQFTSLGTLPGGNWSEAHDINSAGQIAGYWGNNIFGPWQAFLWEDGKMIDLGPSIGDKDSRAFGINADGLVTGWVGTGNIIDSHAFIWDDGKVIELPFIRGGFTSEGHAINSHGDVAGWGRVQDIPVVVHGFIWTNGKMTDIGTLPGFESTTARAINDARVVVGAAEVPSPRAFVWQDGEITALNDLIPPEFGLNMRVAIGINNAGQIVVRATDQFSDVVAVLVTPIQETLGDLDNDCRVGASDLLLLLSSWGPCENCEDCPADFNGDCTVSAADLLILLANWG